MLNRILIGLLFLQANSQAIGHVTGQVMGSDGKPAAGVRVFAVPVETRAVNDTASMTIESLAITDASGRYQLEIPAGRYAIAAGSVESPTFYPSSSSLTAATTVTITDSTTMKDINFSRFVPASAAPGSLFLAAAGLVPPPGSTGILSGVVRNADGMPAAGIPVSAVTISPIGAMPLTIANTVALPAPLSFRLAYRSATDAAGRYRFINVAPDTYYVVAGYREDPLYYPGATTIAAASAIVTTPTTNLNTLDMQIPLQPPGMTIRGKALAKSGETAPNAMLEIGPAPDSSISPPLSLLSTKPVRRISARTDGTFEIPAVSPGDYSVTANLPYVRSITRNITVADKPLADVDFAFPVERITGRILWDDGTPAMEIGKLAIRTGSLTSVSRSLELHVTSEGRFSELLEDEEYRIFFLSLSEQFTVQSVTKGTRDLAQEFLSVPGDTSSEIEVRVGKRLDSEVKLSGKILDSTTGNPTSANRIMLCCYPAGPIERIISQIKPDGTFQFHDVPPGQYTAGLEGNSKASLLNPVMDVSMGTDVTWLSTEQPFTVSVRTVVEGFGIAPSGMSVTFIGSGVVNVTGTTDRSGILRVTLPTGERFRMSVTSVPDGYTLKSAVMGSLDVLTNELIGTQTGSTVQITISLGR
jgi:hypothetical protein